MIRMIRDAETATDQIDYSGAGPQIGGVSEGRGTFEEHLDELLAISGGQLGRTAGGRDWRQSLNSVVMIGRKPPMHRAAIDRRLARYLAGTETFAEELHGLQSPPFQGPGISVWSHVSPPEKSMRH